MLKVLPASFRASRPAGLALLVAAAAAIAVHGWFTASLLLPFAIAGRPVEYIFLGASLGLPVVFAAAAAGGLAVIHRRWITPIHPLPWSYDALDYLAPVTLLAAAPLAGLALMPRIAWALPVLLYVLVDLRVWWTAAIAIAAIARFDAKRSGPWRNAAVRIADRLETHRRAFALDAALFLVLITVAIVSSPLLRFTGILHGDEPKYIRYCESFYQGQGVEVGHQRQFSELTLAYSPPVWRNALHFVRAVRTEARNLSQDFRTLVRDPRHQFNRSAYTDAWFFIGKDSGFYQVHNPGLSVVLFPAYFIDRHFISSSAGYQRVFPAQLPATNLWLLIIWAVWGVVLFRLLEASTGLTALSWTLAGVAMLTMPVAAFPFQVYPETTGGLILATLILWLLFGNGDGSRASRAAAAGAAAALLPWLHIRMILLSLVLFGAAMVTLRRRRLAFAVAYAAGICALSLYSYHLTGSLRPDAMYSTEGGPAAWTLSFALESARAIPFDRIWGFFPHAPVYLLSIAGWVPLFRAQPRLAVLLALSIAALVVPAAGHGFSAAGATPLRQSVAVVPLAIVPLAWTLTTWGDRRWLRASFAVLAVVSLDMAWSYNRWHIKETGRLIDSAVSGWTTNLLFPWTHSVAWAEWRGTFVLFALWVVVAVVLFLAPLASRRRGPSSLARLSIGEVGLATIGFVLLGTGATALGGEWTRGDYFLPVARAREMAAQYAAGTDRCHACYSSVRGEIGRSDILADENVRFAFAVEWSDVAAGEEARFVATVKNADGPAWGSVAIDFGDGETTRADVFGSAVIPHVYRTAGTRKAVARLAAFHRVAEQFSTTVSVRPASMTIAEVDGLPVEAKASPERGSVGRVLLGPDGLLDADAPAAQRRGSLWLVAWNGERWQARPGSEIALVRAGTWVAMLRVADGSRSAPLMLRWPNSAVAAGAPVILNR